MGSIEGRIQDRSQLIHHAVPLNWMLKAHPGIGEHILDIGIGDGGPTDHALNLNGIRGNTIGFDLNPFPHKKDYSNWKSGRLALVQGDGAPINPKGGLPFMSEAFPAVICAQMIEHLPPSQQKPLVRELIRVTKPGGIITIATINANYPFQIPGHDDHKGEFDLHGIQNFIKSLENEEISEAHLFGITPSEQFNKLKQRKVHFSWARAVKDMIPLTIKNFISRLLSNEKKEFNTDKDFTIDEIGLEDVMGDSNKFIDYMIVLKK
jgi:SAM-dependent methyltransferase